MTATTTKYIGVTPKVAHAFLGSDDWARATCARCETSLESGGGPRPSHGTPATRWKLVLERLAKIMSDEPEAPKPGQYWHEPEAETALGVDVLCHDCIYLHDADEHRYTGIMSGSSMATTALIRHDFGLYRPFFDTECSMTPTIQAVWEKYKTREAMNDPNTKRAILINTRTGKVYARTWGEDFKTLLAKRRCGVKPDDVVIEIFDSLCGYVGIEIYQFGRANGMWVSGTVRESGAGAWYTGCYADRAYIDMINTAVRDFIGLPVGYSLYEYGVRLPAGFFGTIGLYGAEERKTAAPRAWEHAENNVRAYLSRTYGIPEFQPGWIEGSGYSPMSSRAVREYRFDHPRYIRAAR